MSQAAANAPPTSSARRSHERRRRPISSVDADQRERHRRQRQRHERRAQQHDDDRGERRVEADEQRDRDVETIGDDAAIRTSACAQRLGKSERQAARRRDRPDEQRRDAEQPDDQQRHECRLGGATPRSRPSRGAPARAPAGSAASGRAAASRARRAAARRVRASTPPAMNFVAWRPRKASARMARRMLAATATDGTACRIGPFVLLRSDGGNGPLHRLEPVRERPADTASFSSRPLSAITGWSRQSRSTRAIARRFTIVLRWICQNASGSSSSKSSLIGLLDQRLAVGGDHLRVLVLGAGSRGRRRRRSSSSTRRATRGST